MPLSGCRSRVRPTAEGAPCVDRRSTDGRPQEPCRVLLLPLVSMVFKASLRPWRVFNLGWTSWKSPHKRFSGSNALNQGLLSTPLRHPLMKGMKVQTGCCSMDRCLGRTGCEFAFKGLRSSGFDHRLPWRIAAVFRYIPSVGQEQDRRWVQKRNGHAIKTEHR